MRHSELSDEQLNAAGFDLLLKIYLVLLELPNVCRYRQRVARAMIGALDHA